MSEYNDQFVEMPSQPIKADYKRNTVLSKEQKQAFTTLRTHLQKIFNPDNFSKVEEKNIITSLRAVIDEPCSINGRFLIPEASQEKQLQASKELWGSVCTFEDKNYPVIMLTKDASQRLQAEESFTTPDASSLLSFAKDWLTMIGKIPSEKRGIGEISMEKGMRLADIGITGEKTVVRLQIFP